MSQAPALAADVVVIGAGPAGAVAALNLAPFLRVLVVDRGGEPAARIGENLPAAAGRLLRDMGLYEAFVAQAHAPCQSMRSTWGGPQVHETDAIRNLDGAGWHLDRRRFDAWLREMARERGAAIVDGTMVQGIERGDGADRADDAGAPWRLALLRDGRPLVAEARFVIDASGRRALLGRRLGGGRASRDRLVCGWVFGSDARPEEGASEGDATELHAESAGWWYTASLPAGGRVLAFYTDADLPEAGSAHSRDALLARAASVPDLARHLAGRGFRADGDYGFCAAHTATQDAMTGPGWLAVGDAALAFDPLSSQGLFNALYTGLAGADAVYRLGVEGNTAAFDGYRRQMERVRDIYLDKLRAYYRIESRWPDQPFWRRRREAQDGAEIAA